MVRRIGQDPRKTHVMLRWQNKESQRAAAFQMEQPLFWKIACAAQKCCLPREPNIGLEYNERKQTLKYGNIYTHQPGKMVCSPAESEACCRITLTFSVL